MMSRHTHDRTCGTLTVCMLFLFASPTVGAVFTWTGAGGTDDWHTAANWAPNFLGTPGFGDQANVLSNSDVDLSANAQGLIGLALLASADVSTNGHQLTVVNLNGTTVTTIVGTGSSGNNTQLFVEDFAGAIPGFIADEVEISNGGELDLTAGGIAQINRDLFIDELSRITGSGTIRFSDTHNDTSSRLDLHGTIEPDFNSTLRIVAESGEIDLDGSPAATGVGVIDLTNSGARLEIDGPLADAFSGLIEMRPNTELHFSQAWDLATNGALTPRLNFIGGTGSAEISGGEMTVGDAAEVDIVSGTLQVTANSRWQSQASTLVNGNLQLEGSSALITGGNWTGTGVVNLDSTLTTIAAATTVNMPQGSFDLDGNVIATVVAINQPLTLNVASVDDDTNAVDNRIQINGVSGQLNVNLTSTNRYTIDHQGALELNGPGGGFVGAHLNGSDIFIEGGVDVSGNSLSLARLFLSGNTRINNGGWTLQNGDLARPNWILADATFSGNGSLRVGIGTTLQVQDAAIVGVSVENVGRFEPGLSLGSVIVAGYEQTASGVLGYEIGGSPGLGHDLLTVTGLTSIAGEIEVSFEDGFAPQEGDNYLVIDGAPLQTFGTFDTLTIQTSGPLNVNGSMLYVGDNVFFSVGDVTLIGDFNDDQVYDCTDIDALVAEIAGGGADLSFDLNSDMVIDHGDLEAWLDVAGNWNVGGAYLPGDANLDGNVDGQDFVIWNANKFTEAAAWCLGDFTANGFVDGADFIEWNAHKFMSSDGLPIAVPEPATLTWLGLGLALGLRRRR